MAEMTLRKIIAKMAARINFPVTLIYHSMKHKLHPWLITKDVAPHSNIACSFSRYLSVEMESYSLVTPGKQTNSDPTGSVVFETLTIVRDVEKGLSNISTFPVTTYALSTSSLAKPNSAIPCPKHQ